MSFMLHAFICAQVGVGTDKPKATLDVEGEVRISEKFRKNSPKVLMENAVPLYVYKDNGVVKYAPAGFTRVSGGYRPGNEFLIAKLPINNTMVRIRFMMHVDASNVKNNKDREAYMYGDLVIIGTGPDDPIRFIEVNLKDADGKSKSLLNKTATVLHWKNGGQLETRITINQKTGELTIFNDAVPLSYFFEIFGGI